LKNFNSFINSGFTNILGSPDPKVKRLLTRLSFIHLGDPFQPFIYGQLNFPLQIAVNYGIKLIMYGENGEVEYGGDMKNAYTPKREVTDQDKHYFSGLPPEFWKKYNISDKELYPYKAPSYEKIINNGTEIHFLSYYKFWDPFKNFEYVKENTGFSPSDERSEGTYTNFASLDDKMDGFHYFLSYIKFGIGRTTSDTAHEIRDGVLTREKGIELIKKYDGEMPSKYYKDFLEYCDLTEDEFWEVIDSWRSDHIWTKSGSEWVLKNVIS